MRLEDHHLLFDRVSWESRKESRWLRRNTSLIIPLEHDTHKELHKAVPAVPLLGYHALYRTMRDYERGDGYIESLENLQRVIEEAGRSSKAHYIERQIGELAIHVIDLQKPFILNDYSGKENSHS